MALLPDCGCAAMLCRCRHTAVLCCWGAVVCRVAAVALPGVVLLQACSRVTLPGGCCESCHRGAAMCCVPEVLPCVMSPQSHCCMLYCSRCTAMSRVVVVLPCVVSLCVMSLQSHCQMSYRCRCAAECCRVAMVAPPPVVPLHAAAHHVIVIAART